MAYNQYFRPKSKSLNSNKEAGIERMVARREKSIQSFTDKKSMSIAISSAFNGAASLCTALVQIGKIEPESFWEEHEKWYTDYLERFLDKQEQPKEEYNQEPLQQEKVVNSNEIEL